MLALILFLWLGPRVASAEAIAELLVAVAVVGGGGGGRVVRTLRRLVVGGLRPAPHAV